MQSYQAPNRLWVSLGAIVLLALIIASGAYLGSSSPGASSPASGPAASSASDSSNDDAAQSNSSNTLDIDSRQKIGKASTVSRAVATLDADNLAPNISGTLHFSIAQDNGNSPQRVLDNPYLSWQNNDRANINLGYQKGPVWVRLDFNTRPGTPPHWVLEQANPLVDQMDVYLYRHDALIQHWQSGDRLPYSQRPLLSPTFLFPINLQPNAHYLLLIRVQSTEALELPLRLMEATRFQEFNSQRSLIDGVFYGFLIIMAAYSFALYLNLQDRTYLYYVAYVLSMLLFFTSQQGYLYQYLFPQHPLLQHYSAPMVSFLIFCSIALFFKAFLDFNKKIPKIWNFYKALLVAHGILCVLLFFIDYQTVIFLMVFNTSLATLLAAASIVHLALQGSRSAQIVLVGWALLITCIMFFVAARTGLAYNEFMANYGLRLGISFEILIFSFGLSFRINQEREEKALALKQMYQERDERIRAQALAREKERLAIQATEQALALEIKQRENLEFLVAQRTEDLERTLLNLEQANQELEALSTKDGLTNIFNRRAFNRMLEEYWHSACLQQRPLSLLLVDIDHFKMINDKLGHQGGDYVLQEFANLLTGILKRPADRVSRYGGEEFAILLPDTPQSGAESMAAMVVERASKHAYQWQSEPLRVTVSVGVYTFSAKSNDSGDVLISNADSALYQAKKQGRNRWVTYSSPQECRVTRQGQRE